MLVVACMDGASGSSRYRRLRRRDYMSNIVTDAIKEMKIGVHCFFEGKGGIWNFWDRKLRDFIRDNNEHGNTLVCVGKSYGAKDVKDEVNKFISEEEVKYDEVRLLFVDAEWIFRGKRKLFVAPVDAIFNVYQRNSKRLNGAEVSSIGTKTIVQTQITDEDVDHFNIVCHPTVKDMLEEALTYG